MLSVDKVLEGRLVPFQRMTRVRVGQVFWEAVNILVFVRGVENCRGHGVGGDERHRKPIICEHIGSNYAGPGQNLEIDFDV